MRLSILTRRRNKHGLPGGTPSKQDRKQISFFHSNVGRLLNRVTIPLSAHAGWPRDHPTWDILDLDSMDSCKGLTLCWAEYPPASQSYSELRTTHLQSGTPICVHGSVRRVYPPEKRLGRKPATDSRHAAVLAVKNRVVFTGTAGPGRFLECHSVAVLGGWTKGTSRIISGQSAFSPFRADHNPKRTPPLSD